MVRQASGGPGSNADSFDSARLYGQGAGKSSALKGKGDFARVPHRTTHFVGFKDDRYWNAAKVFGLPDFIHPGWDLRARREIADGDLIVFADGPADQEPRRKSF